MESSRSIFSGFFVIVVAVVIMTTAVAIFLNAGCQTTFDSNLPIYPDAQILNQRFPFLGDKWMQLYIPASTTDVRTWYNKTTIAAALADKKNGTNTAWRGKVDIAPAGDGVGTNVFLLVGCQ